MVYIYNSSILCMNCSYIRIFTISNSSYAATGIVNFTIMPSK